MIKIEKREWPYLNIKGSKLQFLAASRDGFDIVFKDGSKIPPELDSSLIHLVESVEISKMDSESVVVESAEAYSSRVVECELGNIFLASRDRSNDIYPHVLSEFQARKFVSFRLKRLEVVLNEIYWLGRVLASTEETDANHFLLDEAEHLLGNEHFFKDEEVFEQLQDLANQFDFPGSNTQTEVYLLLEAEASDELVPPQPWFKIGHQRRRIGAEDSIQQSLSYWENHAFADTAFVRCFFRGCSESAEYMPP